MLSAPHEADVKLADLARKVGAPGGLRFEKEEVLFEKLGVRQGCVNAFALINDKNHDVKFIVDEDILNGKYDTLYFHPMDNAASTAISPADLLKYLEVTGHKPIAVHFDPITETATSGGGAEQEK